MATGLIKPPEIRDEPEQIDEAAVMSFFEHLDELRERITRAVFGLAVAMVIAFFFTSPVLQLIKTTYGDNLSVIDPTESLTTYLRVALMIAAIIASPLITYQLLMFIVPGLTKGERRWVIMSLPALTGLFIFGVLFTWFLLVPAYVAFLKGFESDVFKTIWTADNYIGFITAVLVWHGAAFETPLIFFVLGRLGVVTAPMMLKFWRHAVVVAAVVAGFITPTIDPVTMLIVTIILVALYFASVALVAATSGWKRVA